ncbi:pleurocidin-like peptide WF3 [Thunnus maccoyii]|uniref:pleurocidin-like peptide WF3 n=1 Tax=Thunnus maccoyii TaxID=8240 RepID=UPI001C4D311E|nr:pleurocidin-like peptide WF3 [Thunnus maccoyii]
MKDICTSLQQEKSLLTVTESLERMKCTVVFLVLSMVVLMAEPGESFVGLIVKGAFHAGKWIHRLVRKHRGRGFEQEQLDKRSFDYNAGRPRFD